MKFWIKRNIFHAMFVVWMSISPYLDILLTSIAIECPHYVSGEKPVEGQIMVENVGKVSSNEHCVSQAKNEKKTKIFRLINFIMEVEYDLQDLKKHSHVACAELTCSIRSSRIVIALAIESLADIVAGREMSHRYIMPEYVQKSNSVVIEV